MDALENLILFNGRDNASKLIQNFKKIICRNKGLLEPGFTALPYDNSISQYEESDYPGDWELEEKNKTLHQMERINHSFKKLIKSLILEVTFQHIHRCNIV